MSNLSLHTLREANLRRMAQYADKRGNRLHSKDDGSDWTPSQWLVATMGELGELAEIRMQFEAGLIDLPTLKKEAGKEAADTLTYLDITSMRILDEVKYLNVKPSGSEYAAILIARIGNLCGHRKKYERGDFPKVVFLEKSLEDIEMIRMALGSMEAAMTVDLEVEITPNAEGVDLAQATADKFNEISERVGADTHIHDDNVIQQLTHPIQEL